MVRKKSTDYFLLFIGIAFLIATPNFARGQNQIDPEYARLAEKGEGIFQQKCSSCHTVGGGDTPMGPDLAGVTERRDREWLQRKIMEPDKLVAEGDPTSLKLKEKYGMAMPDMGITQEQLQALMAFLSAPTEAEHYPAEPTAKRAPKGAITGNPEQGKALYVGSVPLENGGAPCLACHGIGGAGLGMAAGASYGSDLTNLYENYGPEGVISILETLPFPSMEPIYSTRPLTDEEQQDLAAFFAAIAEKEPVQMQANMALQAGGAILAFGLVFFLFGWGRLRSVRRPLVETASKNTRRKSR